MVDPITIVTAAHCVPSEDLVAVVASDIKDWPTAPKVPVDEVRVHPGYSGGGTNKDDIAVLKVRRQSAATVPLAFGELAPGWKVRAVGWGCTSKPFAECKPADSLMETELPIATDSECAGIESYYNESSICTRTSKTNIRPGDSGGPLVFKGSDGRWIQLGVASVQADSRDGKIAEAGFTAIGSKRSWITNHVKVFNDCARVAGASSISGDTPAVITWHNNSPEVVRVNWLDYSGSAVFYEELQPGDTFHQQTWLTHPWVILDSDGNCRGSTVADQIESDYAIY